MNINRLCQRGIHGFLQDDYNQVGTYLDFDCPIKRIVLIKKFGSIFPHMNQLVRKLLSIMLIFLLGLSPLQSVIADLSAPVDQTNLPCHRSADQPDIPEVIQQSANDCEMCTTANDCDNLCAQCITNGLALLQDLTSIPYSTSSTAIIQLDEKTTNQQPPALFRPPRV